MSSDNFFIKSEKLNLKARLPQSAMTQNFKNVCRQNENLRLQNPYPDQ